MYRPLRPCSRCARHVFAVTEVCPFCAELTGFGPAPERGLRVPAGSSRATMLLLSSSLALGACAESIRPLELGDARSDQHEVDVPPALPDVRARVDVQTAETGRDVADAVDPCDVAIVLLYGGPPPVCDAGVGPDDQGGGGTEYGAPPPPLDGF